MNNQAHIDKNEPHEATEQREGLKPCPFCGGKAKRFTLGPDEEPANAGGDVIVCTGVCGCSSHVEFGRKENLVSLWNTRHQSTTSLEAERDALAKRVEELEVDAERWRAFVSCARFKTIGSANFDHSAYPEVSVKTDIAPGDWLHFGLEVWDRHPVREGEPGWEQGVHGRNLLMAYVEHRRAALNTDPSHAG